MIEEKDYDVTITIQLRTRVAFAAIERDGPLTVFDAIQNAVGAIPSEVWPQLEDGFGGEFTSQVNFTAHEL